MRLSRPRPIETIKKLSRPRLFWESCYSLLDESGRWECRMIWMQQVYWVIMMSIKVVCKRYFRNWTIIGLCRNIWDLRVIFPKNVIFKWTALHKNLFWVRIKGIKPTVLHIMHKVNIVQLAFIFCNFLSGRNIWFS